MSKVKAKKRVGIVGARGYSGLEIARILLKHPEAELVACFAHDVGFSLSDYLPEAAAASVPVLSLSKLEESLPQLDTVFLATPTEASLELAQRILNAKDSQASVIDLSGAFRFQTGTEAERAARFETWYKIPQAKLQKATYGLVPFAAPVKAEKALISNPGCYATAVLMGIIPLLKAKAIVAKSLVIDAKSGTSGAGRKASEAQLFTEVEGECLPYRVGKHQHLPEIREWAEAFGAQAIDPFFVTHLLPVRRGIIASMYADLENGVGEPEVKAAFADAYKNYPLAKVTSLGEASPQLSPNISLSLKRVVGTARVHITYQVIGKKLYFFSLIDNLLKGAASQAVENFNQMNDFPVALGLDHMEGTL